MAHAGLEPEIVRLRDFEVRACMGCSHCAKDPHGRCVLRDEDQAGELFAKLLGASAVAFTSPIYFYHLPAGFKAWIDRSQSYYVRWEAGDAELAERPGRLAYACLVAGRPRGQKLFEGSLLSLKFFLKPFGFSLCDSVTFMGKDAAGSLTADPEAVRKLEDLGRAIAAQGSGG
jgi:multimeric flavodoxin WrbA